MERDMHRVHTDTLTRKEKRALWDEIIQDFINSGEGFTSYSSKHKLNYDQLVYYVRTYQNKQPNKSAVFLPVQITESLPQAEIKIAYANISINLPSSLSPNYIVELIQGLSKSC